MSINMVITVSVFPVYGHVGVFVSHLHRRSLSSDSVTRHFSPAVHIRTSSFAYRILVCT